jgi:hypothetical protein
MTSIVQSVPYTSFGGGASKTVTVSATTVGNSIIVPISLDSGATQYTAPGVTDNAAGGSNVYTVRKTNLGSGSSRSAFIADCLNAPKSCTQITITPTGGTGGGFGPGGVLEAAGGTYAADQSGTTNGTAASPLVVTNTSVDTGTADLVVGVVGRGNGSLTTGISDPPAGYTSIAVQQNDQSDGAGECCYRINASALTDSVSWASTTQTSGDPGILQSYSVTAAAAGLGQPWQNQGQMGAMVCQ